MRFLALGLVVVVGFVGSAIEPGNASSTQPPTLTIEPSDATIGTADSVSVDIRATIAGEPLQRYSLVLRFDDDDFIAARCEYPLIPQRLPSGCNTGFASDGVSIVGFRDPAVSGEWLLARVVLAATGNSGSSSDLTIDVVEFSGVNGALLNPLANTSAVSIDGVGTSAIIMGSVFEDTNENGTFDPAEPGISSRNITVFRPPSTNVLSSSRTNGTFVFADLPPGQYQISTELDQVIVAGCPTDSPSSFHPLDYPVCPPQTELFEPTTPEIASVTASAGTTASVDFGGRRIDIQDVGGQAILRGDYAPVGATVNAKANGHICGSATISQGGSGLFGMEIRGERESSGCAAEGEIVSFEVAGVPADEAVTWQRAERIGRVDPVAMPDHAWYWLQQPAGANVALVGAAVDAVIDGKTCGSTKIEQAPPGFSPGPGPVGFNRLVVPRDSISPNCGRPGSAIRFLINGTDAGIAITWEPGIQKLDLPLGPLPSISPEPTPNRLPLAGGSPGGEPSSLPLAAGVAITVVSAFCATVAIATRLRRPNP